MHRRQLLQWTGIGFTALVTGCAGEDSDPLDSETLDSETPDSEDTADTDLVETDLPDTDVQDCTATSDDIEGPYWIEGVPVRQELDLYDENADGLSLSGNVRDVNCTPLANAVVEIWHANSDGDYDNVSDEMRYRGQTSTDADGNWSFHTILPGKYPGRPLHIHLKVWVRGSERLTTQIYFEGQPDNQGVPADLIIALTEVEAGELSGEFPIVLS